MRVSRTFIKLFLVLLLVIVIGNIAAMVLGSYQSWMAYTTIGFFIALFSLVFRKSSMVYVKALAWGLPVVFVLFLFVAFFMSFGHVQNYSINVSNNGSVHSSSSNLYFENVSGNIITNLSDIYLLGYVNLVLKRGFFSSAVNVSAVIDDKDAHFGRLSFKVEDNKWDYMWNFNRASVASAIWGSAKYDSARECTYFNASKNQNLSYFNSGDIFESSSFIVYAKWKPENVNGTNQQIIGHSNWELLQNNNSVEFSVLMPGRNVSAHYFVNNQFFNGTHEAIAVYFADNKNSTGYVELYIDGNFADRISTFNNTILIDYGNDAGLTFGKNKNGSYFGGCIYQIGFDYRNMSSLYLNNLDFQSSDKIIKLPIVGNGNLSSIKLSLGR